MSRMDSTTITNVSVAMAMNMMGRIMFKERSLEAAAEPLSITCTNGKLWTHSLISLQKLLIGIQKCFKYELGRDGL